MSASPSPPGLLRGDVPPELYRPDDPELVQARDQARALLYPPAAEAAGEPGTDGMRAAVAAWSLVHGLATLWLNHNLPPSWATTPSRSPATSPATSSERRPLYGVAASA
jgi:hypothetical protein